MSSSGPVAVIAAVANFALALLALARGGPGPLTRLLAALAAALGVWNAALAFHSAGAGPFALQGALVAAAVVAPLGLSFVLALSTGAPPLPRRLESALRFSSWALAAAYAATVFVPSVYGSNAFNLLSIGFHSLVLGAALLLLARRLRVSETTVERRLFSILLAGGIVAVVGGVLEFVPALGMDFPRFGSFAVLLYTFLLSGIVIQAGWIRGSEIVAGGLSRIAAAGLSAGLLAPLLATPFFPLFVALVVLLAFVEPLRRSLVLAPRRLDLARGCDAIARKLGRAATGEEVTATIRDAIRNFPEGSFGALYLHDPERSVFVLAQKGGSPPRRLPLVLAEDDEIALALETSRDVLLHSAIPAPSLGSASPARVRTGREALKRLAAEAAVPLRSGDRLSGILLVGGDLPPGVTAAGNVALVLGLASLAAACLERSAAEKEAREKERLAALGEMSAAMAHEIRNPLGAIHGAAQVLEGERERIDPSLRELVAVIARESRRLGTVVSNFLEMGRPVRLHPEPTDLVALATGALRAVRAEGTPTGIELEVSPPPSRVVVPADGDLLGAVFVNLARNAIDSMGESGKLTIRFKCADADGAATVIRFEDTGPGVPEESREAIFRPFFTTKERGSGLGLAISRRIVEAHGGRIACAPRNGSFGATFEIWLPAEEGGAIAREAPAR